MEIRNFKKQNFFQSDTVIKKLKEELKELNEKKVLKENEIKKLEEEGQAVSKDLSNYLNILLARRKKQKRLNKERYLIEEQIAKKEGLKNMFYWQKETLEKTANLESLVEETRESGSFLVEKIDNWLKNNSKTTLFNRDRLDFIYAFVMGKYTEWRKIANQEKEFYFSRVKEFLQRVSFLIFLSSNPNNLHGINSEINSVLKSIDSEHYYKVNLSDFFEDVRKLIIKCDKLLSKIKITTTK